MCKAFVRYLYAAYVRELREFGYRTYVTDALNNIPQMKYTTVRWYDAVKSNGGERDERTAEQIVDHVIDSLSGGA